MIIEPTNSLNESTGRYKNVSCISNTNNFKVFIIPIGSKITTEIKEPPDAGAG